MSLYGSGRREGIGAACLIGVFVVLVHALGALQFLGLHADFRAAAREAIVPALAGVLCYRFLRAQGRSRYAAFLAGCAYALSPWLVSTALTPREQLAAAFAPLALEAASHFERPSHRSAWMPWLGPCLALPFVGGCTGTALLATSVAAMLLLYAWRRDDRSQGPPPRLGMLIAVGIGAALAVSLVWLDPLRGLFFGLPMPLPAEVLASHRSAALGLDAGALLRQPGPILLVFAGLGLLRRQRHASLVGWLTLTACGMVPTLLATLMPAQWARLPEPIGPLAVIVGWWLPLVGIVVLAAAGLDDFLDLPLRRRTALAWLLAFVVAGAPLIPTFGSEVPELEWSVTGTFLLMALLLPAWRRMGILRFKNVLAVASLLALTVPALQVLPVHPLNDPVPLAEIKLVENPTVVPWAHLAGVPLWHYAGGLSALLASVLWALFAWRRRIAARPAPSAAKAAIKKKARPAQRS